MIGKQYIVIAIDLMCHYDFVCLIIYVSISIFVKYSNEHLTPLFVIYAISYYSKICNSLADFTGLALRYHAIAYASVKRIEKFLLSKETSQRTMQQNGKAYIQIKNLSVGYNKDIRVLKHINLTVKERELVGNL